MSWDSYIENLVAQGKGNIDKCCIIDLNHGTAWTTPTHAKALKISAQEGAAIARGFKSKDFTQFMASGIHIDGQKYQFLRVFDDKKTMLGKKKGLGFVSLQCTKQAVVCVFGEESKQQGVANGGLQTVADYLESTGY